MSVIQIWNGYRDGGLADSNDRLSEEFKEHL
jgi:hypothetical protein